MTKKINFTKESLFKLPRPESGQRLVLYDSKQRNLCMIVTDKGSKAFYFRKTINGRPVRFNIGQFPDMSIENARGKITDLLSNLGKGTDVEEARLFRKSEITFGEFFKIYMDEHSKLHKKSWKLDQDLYDRYLKPKVENLKISEFTKGKIEQMHAELGKAAKYITANRLLALISSVFGIAINRKYFKGENPVRGIKKYKEIARDRFITADELPQFFEALNDYIDHHTGGIINSRKTIRDYVLLSLYTGARRSNVLAMQWDQINIKSKQWYIAETKNGTPQTIPLVTEAIELLNERKKNQTDKSPFVFSGNSKSGHMEEPKRAWQDLLKRAGKITNLRIHDLRRSLGSWQAITGASLPIIGKSLNHKSHTSTSIYARLDLDPVRMSMQTAVNAMVRASDSEK